MTAGDKFTCEVCGKALSTKSSLKTHMKLHSKTTAPMAEKVITTAAEINMTPSQQLEDDNEVLIEAAEDQDLYDALDDISKKIDEPEKEDESKEELLISLREKVKRLKTIIEMKTKLQAEMMAENAKQEEVARHKESELDAKDKEIAEKNSEIKKVKKEAEDLSKEKEQLKKDLKAQQDLHGQSLKQNSDLKKELEVTKSLAKTLENKNADEITVLESVQMNKTTSGNMCVTCEKKFRNGQDLEKHIEITHNLPECNICEKYFTSRQELKQHMLKHETAMECSECPFISTKKDAKQHTQGCSGKLSASKEMSYCAECGELNTHSEMKKHMETEHRGRRADNREWEKTKRVCKFWRDGFCKKGDSCRFSHVGIQKKLVENNTGPRREPQREKRRCRNGESCPWLARRKCHFSHEEDENVNKQRWQERRPMRNCKFGNRCRDLPNCRFGHDINSVADFPPLNKPGQNMQVWLNGKRR